MTQWTKENAWAVGKIPSGLFIVTARSGSGDRDGFLGSWIQQVSFEPLLITMAIKAGRPFFDILQAEGRFCVNIIGKENGGALKPFWGAYKPGEDALAQVPHRVTTRGSMVLDGAMGALECRVREILKPGDHHLVIGEVEEALTLKPEDKPMTHIRPSGLDY